MRFIAATSMSEYPFKDFQFDGILGLGLSGLSQAPEYNLLELVARSAGTPSTLHIFGMFLTSEPTMVSELTLGGWSPERVSGDLAWSPVINPELGHWMVGIKSLRVDGENIDFCQEGCRAVVDTGTSLVTVPTVVFGTLLELLRHSAVGDCRGKGPELHIELEGSVHLTLGPRDYAQVEDAPALAMATVTEGVHADSEEVRCKPVLRAMELPAPLGPKLFLLGEPVLQKYYTVYDAQQQRIGFGLARHEGDWQSPPGDDVDHDTMMLFQIQVFVRGRFMRPIRDH